MALCIAIENRRLGVTAVQHYPGDVIVGLTIPGGDYVKIDEWPKAPPWALIRDGRHR